MGLLPTNRQIRSQPNQGSKAPPQQANKSKRPNDTAMQINKSPDIPIGPLYTSCEEITAAIQHLARGHRQVGSDCALKLVQRQASHLARASG